MDEPPDESLTAVDAVYRALLERARHAVRTDDLDDAEQVAREALAHHPELADAYNVLAAIRERQGRQTEAVDLLRAGLAVDPTHAVAQRNLTALVREPHRTRMILGDEDE